MIGRAADCEVPLRDPTVSRRHLLLERVGDKFHFQDLGGSNPVLLDGKPEQSGVVAVGQTLAIGLTRLSLELRMRPADVAVNGNTTVVLSREVADEEIADRPAADSMAGAATRVLDRIEWSFADLGDLTCTAEPLLNLAINLTGRKRGWIGRFNAHNAIETLAALDLSGREQPPQLPETVLAESRRINRPHLVVTQENGETVDRLLVPLGTGPEGMLLLEEPNAGAPQGQDLLRLAHSLSNVVWHRLQETTERQRLRDEVRRLRFHGSAAHNALLASTRLHDVRQSLRTLAGGDEPVLLVGEDGTELEDLARYVHSESPRRPEPFVAWNAVRVPNWRHERDLFDDRPGGDNVLQRARNGTLFLERFDWLAPTLQERLATTLRERRLAGTPTPALVVSSASAAMTHDGSTAFDWLPHQTIAVPPLRSNPRDILALAELFLSELGTRPDGSPRLLTERAKRVLVTYAWPGNVRELRLILESAAAQANDQPIAPRHLPIALAAEAGAADKPDIPTLEQMERTHIQDVMERTGGNRSKAATILGIANSTLYEKLKRLGLDA